MLILVIFIVAFGLVMVYSASSYTAQTKQEYHYDAAYFLKRQAMAVLLGIVAMLIVSKFDYRLLIKPIGIGRFRIRLVTCLYLFSIVLQIVVLFVGKELNGSKRWIEILGMSFQPSEITKIAVILYTSYLIYKAPRAMNKGLGVLRVFIFMLVPIAAVAIENFSTALVIGVIMAGVCFVSSRKKWFYGVAALISSAVMGLFIVLGGAYRVERFEVWRNIETHEKGHQIRQGMYAIASGGMFGTGLGQSMQKLGFIPEAYNDMIFTIICEELGLFGAIVVVAMFLILIWRIFIIAINAPDLFGGLLCAGVLIHIAIQVILNICVVTNFVPATGVALPFISYGGTSISILLAEMGLVLSVSNRIESR
ncbi:MAG: putative lipid II flippase FtsW [Lachnospiraceae bacterium]|nr:putative lipid II flippase FtsW [Lachnospiraceae bacterium]